MKVGPERILQIQIVEWLRQLYPEIFFYAHISESDSTVMWRRISFRVGGIKGLSDLFFPESNMKYKGLVLELKTEEDKEKGIKRGRPSPEQIWYIDKMISLGYDGHITYGFNQSINIIKNFYNLTDRTTFS